MLAQSITPAAIRVMCVDDHPIFREGLAAVLANDPGFELVAEAGTGEEAIEKFRAYRPDVTLMDLRLPGISGTEAIAAIRAEFPDARIVVLTTETGDVPMQRTLNAGAKGYVLSTTMRASGNSARMAAMASVPEMPAPRAMC